MMTEEHMYQVCKVGQGTECCKYLGSGAKGMSCLKLTPFKKTLDVRTNMTAKADNCEGIKPNG